MLAFAFSIETAGGHLKPDPIDGEQRTALFVGKVSAVQFRTRIGFETRSRVCVDVEEHQEVLEP
jgi:hypothetical protein